MPRMRARALVYNNETSVHDAIRREAAVHDGWLASNGTDPNTYPLGTMLTAAGLAGVKAQAQRWLAMQHATFTPPDWVLLAPDDAFHVSCGGGKSNSGKTGTSTSAANELCQVEFMAAPPTTVGLWIAPAETETERN